MLIGLILKVILFFLYRINFFNGYFIGAWLMHVVLLALGKILVSALPGMSQEVSWTIVNCGYMAVSDCI